MSVRNLKRMLDGHFGTGIDVYDLVFAKSPKILFKISGRAVIHLNGAKVFHVSERIQMLCVRAAKMNHAAMWIISEQGIVKRRDITGVHRPG